MRDRLRAGSVVRGAARRLAAAGIVALVAAATLLAPGTARGQEYPGAGDGTLYIGTYNDAIYAIDEATGEVVDRIPVTTGMPRDAILNHDGTRFYVLNVDRERIEVVDIASKRTLDVFSLSEGTERIRIWGYVVNPDETRAVLVARPYERLVDRWEVGELQLLIYDLENDEPMGRLPWPDGEPDFFPSMRFSPDGGSLYFFMDEVRIYETETFTEVDRWEYGRALDHGMGALDFGFGSSPYEEEGRFTGLFRVRDPVNERRLMGVARVDLADRRVDFSTVGPAESLRFTLGPDGRGYGLHNAIGDYQLWIFDLDEGSVVDRVPIQGRPRMRLEASSNGEYLYVWQAGNTIDLVDADTGEYVYTIELDADTTTDLIVVPGAGRSASVGRGP